MGLNCDNRILSATTYVVKKYQYKKTIQIPAGATLILPPPSTMGETSPMGNKPGTTNTIGYELVLVSKGSTYDTYNLVTEDREITHNISGQQIAPLNNPVYIPCIMFTPSNLTFKYQYTYITW